MPDGYVHCFNCGKKYLKEQCCSWIYCECGKHICSNCGKDDLSQMEGQEDSFGEVLWCALQCDNCGLVGCGDCI